MRPFAATILAAAIVSAAVDGAPAADLRLSYNSDWPPYSQGVGDRVGGILPDLLDEIVVKRMGTAVRQNGAPWKRAQRMVEKGQLDGFVTVPTEKRLAFTRRSRNVVYTLEMRAIVRRDGDPRRRLMAEPSLESVRALRVCDILGNGWAERFYGAHGIDYMTVSKVRACLRMIRVGRADVIIQPAATAVAEIAKAGMGDDLEVLPEVYGKMDFALMINSKSPFATDFLTRFDRTLDAMKKDKSYSRLIDRLRGGGGGARGH